MVGGLTFYFASISKTIFLSYYYLSYFGAFRLGVDEPHEWVTIIIAHYELTKRMPNFCPTSGLPLAGKAAERNSSHNRGIGLTTNSKGCCSLQNPILRLSLHLVVILLALTICCSPILQVNRESGQSCPKNQLGPERPAETWEQVKIGYEERAFFCPTKNLYLLRSRAVDR